LWVSGSQGQKKPEEGTGVGEGRVVEEGNPCLSKGLGRCEKDRDEERNDAQSALVQVSASEVGHVPLDVRNG
jgi:hypothetical protein